eukprot:scaffold118711_cov28-Tisochrysis_lutea.AAC.3
MCPQSTQHSRAYFRLFPRQSASQRQLDPSSKANAATRRLPTSGEGGTRRAPRSLSRAIA